MSFIHWTAVVDKGAVIGKDTEIWHFSHIMPGAVIGERCMLGQNVFVGDGAIIGPDCRIQNNVSIYSGVTLEDRVFVGPSVVFTNVSNPRAAISRKGYFEKTLVETGATIGANATILCGLKIGMCSFVGAGAVVLEDVAPFTKVVGNPARVVGCVNVGVVHSSIAE